MVPSNLPETKRPVLLNLNQSPQKEENRGRHSFCLVRVILVVEESHVQKFIGNDFGLKDEFESIRRPQHLHFLPTHHSLFQEQNKVHVGGLEAEIEVEKLESLKFSFLKKLLGEEAVEKLQNFFKFRNVSLSFLHLGR